MFTYFFFIVILTKFIIDGAFSIKTILELAGVVGPVRRAGSICNLHRNSGPTGGGVLAASPIHKLISFL